MNNGKEFLKAVLPALCSALLVLCIVFCAGWRRAVKTSAALPEVQNNGTAIQWRYAGDEKWHDLVALSELRGAAGKNGKDGADGKNGTDGKNGQDGRNGTDGKDGADGQNGLDGKNGDTHFIGENGNWWIGDTDTGIKAAGRDGIDGEKGDKGDTGDKGDPGDKGDKGEKGDAGQNGSCSGYFYASTNVESVFLQHGHADVKVYEKINKGGLISSYSNAITLKKGYVYNVSINGSLEVASTEDSGNYSVQMTDGYDDDLCREVTRIKRDGKTLTTGYEQHSLSFSRMYDATENDITLQLYLEQSAYNTHLRSFKGTVTITALD